VCADGDGRVDAELVEAGDQRVDVVVGPVARSRARGAPEPNQVGNDESMLIGELVIEASPVNAGRDEAVQEEDR